MTERVPGCNLRIFPNFPLPAPSQARFTRQLPHRGSQGRLRRRLKSHIHTQGENHGNVGFYHGLSNETEHFRQCPASAGALWAGWGGAAAFGWAEPGGGFCPEWPVPGLSAECPPGCWRAGAAALGSAAAVHSPASDTVWGGRWGHLRYAGGIPWGVFPAAGGVGASGRGQESGI